MCTSVFTVGRTHYPPDLMSETQRSPQQQSCFREEMKLWSGHGDRRTRLSLYATEVCNCVAPKSAVPFGQQPQCVAFLRFQQSAARYHDVTGGTGLIVTSRPVNSDTGTGPKLLLSHRHTQHTWLPRRDTVTLCRSGGRSIHHHSQYKWKPWMRSRTSVRVAFV